LSSFNPSRTTDGPPRKTFSDVWPRIRRQFVLIALVGGLTGVTAAALTQAAQPVQYVSTVTLVVVTESRGADAETLIRTIQALVGDETVASDVINRTGVRLTPLQLVKRFGVVRPAGSGVLAVTVTDDDQARSRALAAAVVPSFIKRVDELSARRPSEAADDAYTVTPWGATEPNTRRNDPPTKRNGAIGAILGAALYIAALAAREQRVTALAGVADAETSFGLPVLAAVRNLRTSGASAPELAESVTNALLSRISDPQIVVLTGPTGGRERALLVVGIARALSRSGQPVTIVDADVAHRSLSKSLASRRQLGLLDALSGRTNNLAIVPVNRKSRLLRAWPPQDEGAGTIGFLPIGSSRRPVPAALTSGRLSEAISRLAEQGIVIIDAPDVAGSVPVKRLLDYASVVIVVATQSVTSADIARTQGHAIRAMVQSPAWVVLLESQTRIDPPAAEPRPLQPPRVLTGGESRSQAVSE
jgi:Mrp family chromosome partitioning ATPase